MVVSLGQLICPSSSLISTVWPWWMAICGGPTWTLTVMKCSRDGLCSTPSDEIYPSLGVYRVEHFRSPKSRGAFSLTASIECRTSPSAGWALRPPRDTIPDPGYEGHCPSIHNQPLGPCSQKSASQLADADGRW